MLSLFSNFNNKLLYYEGLLLLQCFIWGSGNPIAKIGLQFFTPFYLLSFRFISAFFIFIFFYHKHVLNNYSYKALCASLKISIFTAISFVSSIVALVYTTAIKVGFIISIAIIFVPLFSFFILKSKVEKILFFPITLVVAGLFFFCNVGGFLILGKGELLALVGALSGAFMLVLASKYLKEVSILFISTIQTGFIGFFCLVFALIFEDYPDYENIPQIAWATIAYMAIFCTFVAYIIQNSALKNIPAINVAFLCTTEPIFTAITSYFILGEKLSFNGYIGGALIIIGITIASKLTASKVN